MAHHGAKLRALEQGHGVGNNAELLYRLPLEFRFNLGLANAQEGTLQLAYGNLKLAIYRLSHRDQTVILTSLNLGSAADGRRLATALPVPSKVSARIRSRFRRSAGAFNRLAQVILDGPEQSFGPAPQATGPTEAEQVAAVHHRAA